MPTSHLTGLPCLVLFAATMLAAWPAPAAAQGPVLLQVQARSGQETALLSAPCIRLVKASGVNVKLVAADSGQSLVYVSRTGDPTQFDVDAKTGQVAAEEGADCTAAAAVRLNVKTYMAPDLSADALGKAFNILVATFVLALLLESAFALLFNWRLFQEFVVGRSWRTIIMFAVSLTVVRQFDLDLMATLFDAYRGVSDMQVKRSWLTSALTAMIVGGGSVGVNRILVGLGFRSQISKVEEEHAQLASRRLAYISLTVRGISQDGGYQVNLVEAPCDTLPLTLGIVTRKGRMRLRALLFPNPDRFPRSGGHALDANLCYRISVTELHTGISYDTRGEPIGSPDAASPYRFAPGAIVDFDISVRPGTGP